MSEDRGQWPNLKERLRALFRTKTRDKWCKLMEGTDVCFAPVLSMDEAPEHPHNQLRGAFVTQDLRSRSRVGEKLTRDQGNPNM